uniref:Disease resistance protein At4g27190-like leucine-rich repeats domain-containing protein n=1 Tax=Cajanus cajan TaxID=3821 RepID=A0A151UCI1_CAJCA|nr:hypothetical protein KK1_021257 [Cajanus cajan]
MSFPVEIFEKASNLEYLEISRCRGLVELFLSRHEMRWSRNLMTVSRVCKELQKLCISSCPDLTTLVHSAVSFSNLKHLSIKDCHKLRYLFTSTTARQLVFLEEMYVVECKSMEQIILDEEVLRITSEAIKFEQLTTIILDSLPKLLYFYSGSDTLELSSLMRVLIWKCPHMTIFSRGDIHAESFMGIQVSLDPNQDLLFYQDLNTTVKGMFQLGMATGRGGYGFDDTRPRPRD